MNVCVSSFMAIHPITVEIFHLKPQIVNLMVALEEGFYPKKPQVHLCIYCIPLEAQSVCSMCARVFAQHSQTNTQLDYISLVIMEASL